MLTPYEHPGWIRVDLMPPVTYKDDNVTLGFKTYMQNGTLATFVTPEGKYWSLRLVDGRLKLDVNGHLAYLFTEYPFSNGQYHVISTRRIGKSMIITLLGSQKTVPINVQTLTNDVGAVTYSHFLIGADHQESDVFKGAIGGFHWNGRYPLDELRKGILPARGNVTNIFLPNYQLIQPPPQPLCFPNSCMNGGRCYTDNYELKCDCSTTGYHGFKCARQYYGFQQREPGGTHYAMIRLIPEQITDQDEMRILFQTHDDSGSLVHLKPEQPHRISHGIVLKLMTGLYAELKSTTLTDSAHSSSSSQRDGNLYSEIDGEKLPLSVGNTRINDGQLHVINLNRKGSNFNYTVDNFSTFFNNPGLSPYSYSTHQSKYPGGGTA
ncbi:Neurexin-3-beta, partial [Cichlidogyrus casuarinus]